MSLGGGGGGRPSESLPSNLVLLGRSAAIAEAITHDEQLAAFLVTVRELGPWLYNVQTRNDRVMQEVKGRVHYNGHTTHAHTQFHSCLLGLVYVFILGTGCSWDFFFPLNFYKNMISKNSLNLVP